MRESVTLFIKSFIPVAGLTADMNPHVFPSLRPVKGSLSQGETTFAPCSPVPKSHPGSRLVTTSDLVAAVDHLSTGEALELELALRARVAIHSTLSGCNSLKSFFAAGSLSCVHVKFRLEVFVSYVVGT